MSLWRTRDWLRAHPPQRPSFAPYELAIIAAGLLAAALFGVVCSGGVSG